MPYRIVIELEPVGAFHHAHARAAAQRVSDAIEAITDADGDLQLVEVVSVRVEKVVEPPPPPYRGRGAGSGQ